MTSFKLTSRQEQATALLASASKHCMLFGGSRSGKTFALLRAIAIRGIKAPKSRHACFRYRFNHIKTSIVADTWPKMMDLCFPKVKYRLDRTDWFAEFPNGSEIWFGGLDDKERTEKILGQEHVTLYFNECSQIARNSILMAETRLAQKVIYTTGGGERQLALKAYYDCNPPSQAHWAFQVFKQLKDPDSRHPLPNPGDYASLQINPKDNAENLPDGYLQSLESMPRRMRERFLLGEFGSITDNALWTLESIDKWRVIDGELPDFQRIIVAVDPSGSGDEDNADNDEIGIIVGALGVDGIAYVLEDLTLKTGPAKWGKVAGSAFDRHQADLVVGEKNFGGDMVRYVIQTARPGTPFKPVNASRGKVVRAEPISALYEQGKIRHVGNFDKLEDELCGFTTTGYMGERSPNRADALVWCMSELFPGMVRVERPARKVIREVGSVLHGWMG